ncbi:MAG TPA: CopD family protein [Denitromonas sp.]|uniref:CopD family protein n=1 Tax=Denitromonas sp. TaxID=2734609 RepID=UPI001E06B943|nr:CopD family protein [Rhodocyclaceae bacterium]MCP5220590.1 CopD family protein [Zoogloeaceae bacterium]HPR05039.1 CopD family protein [Denitromonas sp.]HQU87104.1 CopD family protein [Denitromonas sp.]HQV13896.1 CopD family protein [Denitromonas sp.]
MNAPHIFLFFHLLAVIVWVGGMAFAYLCLRPAAGVLAPPDRLRLWQGVFSRFFPMVWVAVIAILLTGFGGLLNIGFANAPLAWHIMMSVGLVMIFIYAYVWFVPWQALKRAVAAERWPDGAAALGRIRQAVAVNTSLGLINVAVATLGLAA